MENNHSHQQIYGTGRIAANTGAMENLNNRTTVGGTTPGTFVSTTMASSVVSSPAGARYPLPGGEPEITRLERQHRVFQPAMMDLIEKGIEEEPVSGYRILDVGCGPGFETVLLANKIASIGGEVIGMDVNEGFLHYARQINTSQYSNVKYRRCDIASCEDTLFPDSYFNMVYFRLTLCWMSDVERVLRKVHRWLTRDGRIMCIEPIFEGGFTYPYSQLDKKFAEAAKRLLSHGDAFIGARLPELFERLNMQILYEEPFVLFGGPGSVYSHYIRDSTYYLCDLLLAENLLSLEDVAMYKQRLESLERSPMTREYSQILVKFVACKHNPTVSRTLIDHTESNVGNETVHAQNEQQSQEDDSNMFSDVWEQET